MTSPYLILTELLKNIFAVITVVINSCPSMKPTVQLLINTQYRDIQTRFIFTYRFTKSKHILEAAENVSNYYIDNSPEDGIAYWDFNVPHDKYSYIPRDSSSVAIAASALFELYGHTKKEKYLKAAQRIMDSLSLAKYRANGHPEYKLPALLVN